MRLHGGVVPPFPDSRHSVRGRCAWPLAFRVVQSPSAAIRLDAAARVRRAASRHQPVTIVAATRGAADDFARRIARRARRDDRAVALQPDAARGARRGARLAGRGIAPASLLGAEAVAARAAFERVPSASLTYLHGRCRDARLSARAGAHDRRPAARGDSRRTRLLAAGPGRAGPVAALLERTQRELEDGRHRRSRAAVQRRDGSGRDDAALGSPLILLDVPIGSPVEGAFVDGADARGSRRARDVPGA